MNSIKIVVDNLVRIELTETLNPYIEDIKNKFTYNNQRYYIMKALGKYVSETDKYFQAYEINLKYNQLILPRGTLNTIMQYFSTKNVPFEIVDNTFLSPVIEHKIKDDITFYGFQKKAISQLNEWKQGVLISDTGSGKTRIMLALIAQKKQYTLIIGNSTAIMKRYQDEAKIMFGDGYACGEIRQGECDIKPITIAMIQTLQQMSDRQIQELNNSFGMIVVSECHHVSAESTWEIINKFKARYRFGESASKTRKDKKECLFYAVLGSRIHEITKEELKQENKFSVSDVCFVPSSTVKWESDSKCIDGFTWASLLNEIAGDERRNRLIVKNICSDVKKGRVCLVLSERIEHCQEINRLLLKAGIKSEVVFGNINLDDRDIITEKARNKEIGVIVATRAIAGEALDIPILSALHLVTPSNNMEMTRQITGRIRRIVKGKEIPIVRDYVDISCPFLLKIAKKRRGFYKKLEFNITEDINKKLLTNNM